MSTGFDGVARDFLARGLFPPPRFWSFDLGAVSAGAQVFTDVIDLGENHRYVLLAARKIGDVGRSESMGIQGSIDGVQWVLVPGPNDEKLFAQYNASNRSVFCVYGRPAGRYVRVVYSNNGSNQLNEVVVELAAFARI